MPTHEFAAMLRSACQCPSAIASTRSWVASSRVSMPAIVPPRITAMRSLMPRISGSSDEIIRIGQAALGELLHERVNFGFRANIDSLRRLIQDENLRRGRQPARERDFLLIAAGEGVDVRATEAVLILSCST